MTSRKLLSFQDAKALRDAIRMDGPWCIVPTRRGVPKYVARIFTDKGERDFVSYAEYEAYKRERDARRTAMRPRSPIEIMVDRACGLE